MKHMRVRTHANVWRWIHNAIDEDVIASIRVYIVDTRSDCQELGLKIKNSGFGDQEGHMSYTYIKRKESSPWTSVPLHFYFVAVHKRVDGSYD